MELILWRSLPPLLSRVLPARTVTFVCPKVFSSLRGVPVHACRPSPFVSTRVDDGRRTLRGGRRLGGAGRWLHVSVATVATGGAGRRSSRCSLHQDERRRGRHALLVGQSLPCRHRRRRRHGGARCTLCVRGPPLAPKGWVCRRSSPIDASLPCGDGAGTLVAYPVPALTPLTAHTSVWRGFVPGTPATLDRAQASRTRGDAPPPGPPLITFLPSSLFFLYFYLEGRRCIYACCRASVCVGGGASLP